MSALEFVNARALTKEAPWLPRALGLDVWEDWSRGPSAGKGLRGSGGAWRSGPQGVMTWGDWNTKSAGKRGAWAGGLWRPG